MAMNALLENKKKFEGIEFKLKEDRGRIETQITSLENEIKEFLSLKDSVPSFRRSVERTKSDIRRLESRKGDLISEKDVIIAKIRKRAKLRGVPDDMIPPKLTNARTERLDMEVSSIDTQIQEKNDFVNLTDEKISKATDYYFLRNKKTEISTLRKKMKSFDKKIYSTWKDIKEVDGLILEEKMRPQYEEYAEENDIEYDEDDDEDIFWQCNLHHHLQLLDGHETYTKCHKSFRDCSEDVILSVDTWGNISGTCECGVGCWEEENPPRDLTSFNINSSHVYGYMNWSGY